MMFRAALGVVLPLVLLVAETYFFPQDILTVDSGTV